MMWYMICFYDVYFMMCFLRFMMCLWCYDVFFMMCFIWFMMCLWYYDMIYDPFLWFMMCFLWWCVYDAMMWYVFMMWCILWCVCDVMIWFFFVMWCILWCVFNDLWCVCDVTIWYMILFYDVFDLMLINIRVLEIMTWKYSALIPLSAGWPGSGACVTYGDWALNRYNMTCFLWFFLMCFQTTRVFWYIRPDGSQVKLLSVSKLSYDTHERLCRGTSFFFPL